MARMFHKALLMYTHFVVFPLPTSASARQLSTYLCSFTSAFGCLSANGVLPKERLANHNVVLWSLTLATVTTSLFETPAMHRTELLDALRQTALTRRITTHEAFTQCLQSVLSFSPTLEPATARVWDLLSQSSPGLGETPKP